jgi:hypothetical protein
MKRFRPMASAVGCCGICGKPTTPKEFVVIRHRRRPVHIRCLRRLGEKIMATGLLDGLTIGMDQPDQPSRGLRTAPRAVRHHERPTSDVKTVAATPVALALETAPTADVRAC